MRTRLLKISYIIVLVLIFALFLFKKQTESKLIYPLDSKIFQYHENDIKNFSFLSKYKNIEALDLTGSSVSNLNFLKNLKSLKVLILNNTKVKDITPIKALNNLEELYLNYNQINDFIVLKSLHKLVVLETDNKEFKFNKNNDKFEKATDSETFIAKWKRLRNYKDLYFSILHNKEVEVLNLSTPYKTLHSFEDISGINQLKRLKILKIVLKNDKYIKYLKQLEYLEELHLSGDIKRIPNFQNSLVRLYLYDMNIKDFSFLKSSKIKELYIITRTYNNSNWKILKAKYPHIKIFIKNRFFTLTHGENSCKSVVLVNWGVYNKNIQHFHIIGTTLRGRCYMVNDLIKNILPEEYLSLKDYIFFLNEVNIDINHLWEDDYTFLDKAIEDENRNAINYLILNNAKQSCRILKTKCAPVSKKIQKLLDKRNNIEYPK